MSRPNFCNDCGERVKRARWRVWTNRRYCQKCTTLRRAAGVWRTPLIVLCLFGAGYLTGGNQNVEPPPLVLERGRFAALNQSSLTVKPAAEVGEVSRLGDSQTVTVATPTRRFDDITDASETVSICGARTKKGTACSRRVRGTGRCWQHKGKAAMLPANKLLIKN